MRGVAFVVHSASGTFREEEAPGASRGTRIPLLYRVKQLYGIIVVAW